MANAFQASSFQQTTGKVCFQEPAAAVVTGRKSSLGGIIQALMQLEADRLRALGTRRTKQEVERETLAKVLQKRFEYESEAYGQQQVRNQAAYAVLLSEL